MRSMTVWISIGLEGEGCARLERLAVLLPDGERRLTSALWAAFARLAAFLKPVRALEAAATAVEAARDADDRDLLARALTTYAVSLSRVRQFQDAAAALAEADALAPSLNVALRLRITGSKALLSYFLGDRRVPPKATNFCATRISGSGMLLRPRPSHLTSRKTSINAVKPRSRSRSSRRCFRCCAPAPTGDALACVSKPLRRFVALDRLAEARAVGREVFQDGSEHDRVSNDVRQHDRALGSRARS